MSLWFFPGPKTEEIYKRQIFGDEIMTQSEGDYFEGDSKELINNFFSMEIQNPLLFEYVAISMLY